MTTTTTTIFRKAIKAAKTALKSGLCTTAANRKAREVIDAEYPGIAGKDALAQDLAWEAVKLAR
jgi:hypothetical protein